MSGPAESKISFPVKAYIHKQDEATGSKVIHIDIESPILNEIILPGESTYVGGKEGGVFIGLRKEMLERAKKLIEKHEEK